MIVVGKNQTEKKATGNGSLIVWGAIFIHFESAFDIFGYKRSNS